MSLDNYMAACLAPYSLNPELLNNIIKAVKHWVELNTPTAPPSEEPIDAESIGDGAESVKSVDTGSSIGSFVVSDDSDNDEDDKRIRLEESEDEV